MPDRSRAANALTIMMTDVVGSTELRRIRGDQDADDILALQAAIVQTRSQHSVAGYASLWVTGSSSPSPPMWQRSVPPLPIQRALEEHNTADPQRAVEVRIGIHTGQVAEQDGDLFGQAVHATARVMAEAVGGQILIFRRGTQARRAAAGLVIPRLGAVLAAGIPGALAAVRGVLERHLSGRARPGAEPARLTAFVERDAERASLRRLVDDALAGAAG